jgi:predicted DNA-binding WGR domain protein
MPQRPVDPTQDTQLDAAYPLGTVILMLQKAQANSGCVPLVGTRIARRQPNNGCAVTRGRAMIELFADLAEADTAMNRHARAKCNRGYVREGTAMPPAT